VRCVLRAQSVFAARRKGGAEGSCCDLGEGFFLALRGNGRPWRLEIIRLTGMQGQSRGLLDLDVQGSNEISLERFHVRHVSGDDK